MRRPLHWGLRARLVVAFVGVAFLAADLATVYSNINLNAHMTSAAHARLERSATHFGEVAGVVFVDNGGWTPDAVEALRHLAEIDDLAVSIVDRSGERVLALPAGRQVEADAATTAPVTAAGREVGEVTVSLANGRLLTAGEERLRHQLNRMHLIAGAVSGAIAFGIALYLALTLSRPLRRIRAGAEAMGAGRLDVRVQESGDDEMQAVARALNRLAESLQREEELRKAGVADLAHELRTPVMGLLGRIEAAQDGVLADEADNLGRMHDEAVRLAGLLQDLSALADAERPGLLLATEPVDVAALAKTQIDAFADALLAKGIAFSSDLDTVVVRGDPARLEQVLVNLLSNALRYTDAGGHVSVTVRRRGDDAVLEVSDTGIGIPAADLRDVFTRFWRGERSRSRATGGAGIGLSIVHELVRAHGGQVTVESVVGEGSTFRVTIPTASPDLLH